MISKRQRSFLISLLMVSLILNIAAAGYIGSRLVRDRIGASITQGLSHQPSPALEHAYTSALQAGGRELLGALARLKQARNAQHEILTAPDYDMDRHADAQADTRHRIGELLTVLHGALRQAAQTLPDQERQKIPQYKARAPGKTAP